MPIIATNKGGGSKFPPLPAGTYPARCYSMIYIGTIKTTINGKDEMLPKIRIGWEIASEMKEFKEGEGPKPSVISKEFTLSLNEKSNLRKLLFSWRGVDFTEEEAKGFDVTKCLGAACMLTVSHKKGNDGHDYADVSAVSPVMKMDGKPILIPKLINPRTELNYDNFDFNLFQSLPEFLQTKIKGSLEYQDMIANLETEAKSGLDIKSINPDEVFPQDDDLPF